MNKFYLHFNQHNKSRYIELTNYINKHLNITKNIDEADYILVAGGDGSLLEAIQLHYKNNKPFIGINAGTLGYYMNEYKTENDIIELADFQFDLVNLPMLTYDVIGVCGHTYSGRALADIYVKSERFAMTYNLCVEDSVINYCSAKSELIYGDGILFSTPIGTTGYAHNLGGSVYPLTTPIYQVLPMASAIKKKKINPFPVSLDTKVTVNFENSDYRSGQLFFDGICLNDQEGFKDFKIKSLNIKTSATQVTLCFKSIIDFRKKAFTWLY